MWLFQFDRVIDGAKVTKIRLKMKRKKVNAKEVKH